MRTRSWTLSVVSAALLLLSAAPQGSAAPAPAAPAQRLHFEPNVGQTAPEVKFIGRGAGHGLFVTDQALVLTLDGPTRARGGHPRPSAPPARSVVRLDFVGAQAPAMQALDRQPGVSRYHVGADPRVWSRDVPNYSRLKLAGLYRGIDLLMYGAGQGLEYDFLVAAGADPAAIRWRVSGGQSVRTDADGALVVSTTAGTLRQHKPIAYQEVGGKRRPVSADYRLTGAGEVTLALGAFDRHRPLVIDPVVSFTRTLAGGDADEAFDVAADASGNVYLAGTTLSSDFPKTAGDTVGDGIPTFVAKYNASGTLLYSFFYGGSNMALPTRIAADSSGQAYVVGTNESNDLPTKNGLGIPPGVGYLMVINGAGTDVVYATSLGDLNPRDLAVAASNDVWVVGFLGASDHPPVAVNGAQRTPGGGNDGFLLRLDPTLTGSSAFKYFSYVGGNGDDQANAVAFSATKKQVYVVGDTTSTNLPLGPRLGARGNGDVFVWSLATDTLAQLGSIVLGGSGFDHAASVAVDAAGYRYVAGDTFSADFPVSANTPSHAGDADSFVIKLTPPGSTGPTMVDSSLVGGESTETTAKVAVTPSGVAWLNGSTTSQTFFTTFVAPQHSLIGSQEGFLTKFNTAGQITFSTYVGDQGFEIAAGVAVSGARVYTGAEGDDPVIVRQWKGDAMLVVGNTTLSAADAKIYNRLKSLGFNVTVRADVAEDDPENRDLIVVSSTVPDDLANPASLSGLQVPVILCKGDLQDDIGMVATNALGVATGQTQINILLSSDKLAAGLSTGNHTIMNTTASSGMKHFNWGKPASAAVKVASISGSTSHVSIYRYEVGATMAVGTAPERRVGFFLTETTAAGLNTTGWKLFDAAVKWAAGL